MYSAIISAIVRLVKDEHNKAINGSIPARHMKQLLWDKVDSYGMLFYTLLLSLLFPAQT